MHNDSSANSGTCADKESDDRFIRIRRMLGEQALGRLRDSFVCVVGLGAVGSYAVEALARAGVGRLRVVDFDQVRPSHINRQLYALETTLGRKKCQLAKERILAINPRCRAEAVDVFIHRETLGEVFAEKPDLVIDAIDSFTPKATMLGYLRLGGVTVVSSMGAALRTDPSLVRTGLLQEVHHCPLAAKLRKVLRNADVPLDIPCVYSIEPVDHLPREALDTFGVETEDTLVRGRKRRTLGSLPTLTGIFGLTAANLAIQMLIKPANENLK